MRRAVTGFLITGAVLAVATPLAAWAGGGDGGTSRRVLIVSLPQVSWEDLEAVELPNLEQFLDGAAVGDLAVRATPVGLSGRATLIGDGYVTMGAGTRAIGGGADTDGQGFGVDEQFAGDRAGQVYRRRTGRPVADGVVQLGIAPIVDENADLPLDAEPGALGDALAEAGHERAVIANADGVEPEQLVPEYHRYAVSGLMTSVGKVPAGRVDDGLLEAEPSAPYGLQYDLDEVLSTFRDVWGPRSVVLVEASDLVRADNYRAFATSDQREVLLDIALRRTDELFGELLESVDLERDAVLLVGPAHPGGETALTVAALRAPGVEAGLLRSATTRRTGYVQLIDVAPTVLDLLGIDRPSSMAGRPFEVGGGTDATSDRISTLIEADQAARFIGDLVEPVTIAFLVANAGLALFTGLWLVHRAPAHVTPGLLQYGALSMLGAIPATYLARLLPFHDLGALAYWAFLVVCALALGAAFRYAGRRHPLDPLLYATGSIVGLLVVDVVLGARLQISSALGNSPIVAGRFTGFGNLAFAAIAAAGLALAAGLATRIGASRGAWMGVGVLAVVILSDGMPFWGADVGGVLSMGPAFLVTAVLLLGWRVRLRTVVLALAGTAIGVAAIGALDLSREPDQRTHLGRLFETIGDEGWSGFSTVIERKLSANFASFDDTLWALGVLVALVFIAFLVRFVPAELRSLAQRYPQFRAAAVGAVLLLALGLVLNDSGIRVPSMMFVVFDATLIVMLTAQGSRITRPTPPPTPDRRALSATAPGT